MPINMTCVACGIHFKLPPSAVERGYKTCSKECRILRVKNEALASRHKPTQPDNYKIVPLPHGAEAKVSNEDYEWVTESLWGLNSRGYAASGGHRFMHHEIAARVYGGRNGEVDHINLDRLDNRRENLRVVTRSQNMMNRARLRSSKHPYKGISKNYNRWVAKVKLDRQFHYIGTFATPEEAAWMYDQFAMVLHGEFASLNFEYLPVKRASRL